MRRIVDSSFKRPLAAFLAAGFVVLPSLTALASSGSFGAGWEPSPLVDPATAAQSPTLPALPSAKPAAPATPPQPNLEEVLKPVLPFVADVEKKLTLSPKAGTPAIQRLNTVQLVLFGEAKYQDAGPLLAKLAELFPAEAAKSQANLQQQAVQQQAALQPAMETKKHKRSSDKNAKPVVQAPAQQAAFAQSGPQSPQLYMMQPQVPVERYGPSQTAQNNPPSAYPQSLPSASTFGQNSGFGNVDDDDWDRDFDDMNSAGGGSRLKSLGQGLMGLAMLAGGVAGSYYLNNKGFGGNNNYPNDYYNSPYNGYYGGAPYGAYGTPYPGRYAGAPYGYAVPYGNPYAYGGYAGAPYAPYRGAYRSGGTVVTRPYSTYGGTYNSMLGGRMGSVTGGF